MMNQKTKLLLAINQVKNVASLIENNEYESYFISHLTCVHTELNRQLTNLTNSSKIKK
jgi:hypothetical protein